MIARPPPTPTAQSCSPPSQTRKLARCSVSAERCWPRLSSYHAKARAHKCGVGTRVKGEQRGHVHWRDASSGETIERRSPAAELLSPAAKIDRIDMGCGSSIAAHEPRHRPSALQLQEPEVERPPVEHLVNRVNLLRDSLSFAENRWHGPYEWRLDMVFDAEAAGKAAVYFGYGGPIFSPAHADSSSVPAWVPPPVTWEFEAGLRQTCPHSLSVELQRFARCHYLAVRDLSLAVPSVPATPSAPSTPASSPEPGAEPSEAGARSGSPEPEPEPEPEQEQELEPEQEPESEPEPEPSSESSPSLSKGSTSKSGIGFCTVVIHLECKDGDGRPQSQTTGLLVEVASAAIDPYGTRPPVIRQVMQTLLVGGRVFDMVDVYGLDANVVILSPLSDPLGTQSLAIIPGEGRGRSNGGDDTETPDKVDEADQRTNEPASSSSTNPSGAAVAASHDGSTLSSAAKYRLAAGEQTGTCVICLCEPLDCVLLPCRHLCVCSGCTQGLYAAAMSSGRNEAVVAAANETLVGSAAMLTVLSGNAPRLPKPKPPKPAVCPICRDRIEHVMQLNLPPAAAVQTAAG
jgi:hypothetical protein